MGSIKREFTGATGDTLVARLDLPVDGAPRAYALFAHCFTCSKNLKAVVNIARALNQARIAVFRFDFTGLGESEGEFAETNFSSNVGDLVAAARFMEREYEAPRILIGHSLGGAAVIRAAAGIPSAEAVATIGAPADPAHVRNLLTGALPEIETAGQAEVALGGRRFTIRKQFLDDLEETGMREALRELRRALLIFHSPVDRVVGIDNAARLFQAARHPKSFISLDTADHLLTDEADSRYVGTVLAAWSDKYVSAPAAAREAAGPVEAGGGTGSAAPVEAAAAATPAAPSGAATAAPGPARGVAARTGPDGYRTEILASGHPLVADEPVAAGGTDAGPSPYDLLAAALGACTSITLRMYADRKRWPLEEIRVRLTHRKVHAEDQRRCESESARLDEMERRLELVGPLDEAQRARLAEIADRCPVHRTLEAGACVVTTLVE